MKNTWCLIGLPDDAGVKNVNGRMGAAGGPTVFRQFFDRLKGRPEVKANMTDAGDVTPKATIAETHEAAAALIAEKQTEHLFTIIVGGGHDLAFPHLKGFRKTLQPEHKMACINIDPHFDMRLDTPAITSGSPFYMALEQGLLPGESMVAFGVQEQANDESLWQFARNKKVCIVPFDDLRLTDCISSFQSTVLNVKEWNEGVVLSLDMDALQAAFAPGVSAPAAEGFTPSEVIGMVRLAARHEKVKSLGIYELNPEFDIDNRTARLAALIAWHFASVKLEMAGFGKAL